MFFKCSNSYMRLVVNLTRWHRPTNKITVFVSFLETAATNGHKLGNLKQYTFILSQVQESRHLKSRCHEGWLVPTSGSRGESIPCLWLLAGLGVFDL